MHISHFFSIKPYWELWNLKVPQKLLASSFSDFKHEKTLLNMVLQSLQAVKKKLKPRFYSKKTQIISKGTCTETTNCACSNISRQAGQEAKVYSEFYICCDTYPAYLEAQCSSPCFTSAFLCAAIETR